MQTFYHITTQSAWQKIQSAGQLTPRIGPRSELFGEKEPLIYGFLHEKDAIDAATNWFVDTTEEPLLLLKIETDQTFEQEAYEVHFNQPISTKDVLDVQENF